MISYVVSFLYFIFQVFRLGSLAVFTVFMIDCTVYHSQTSVDCNINYTIYKHIYIATPACGPYCWKGMWIGCSVLTSVIVVCVVCIPSRFSEPLRPALNYKVICSLVRKQYFWYLNLILGLVILYNAIILSQKLTTGSSKVEIGVIISKVLTTLLIFQLNFTYPPTTSDRFSLVDVSLYYITLFLFVMDNFCKFVELSIRVSYKLYTVNAVDDGKQKEVLILMLEIVDASLYHHFLSFFWNKIFRGRRDVLLSYSPDLAQSLDIQDGEPYHPGP